MYPHAVIRRLSSLYYIPEDSFRSWICILKLLRPESVTRAFRRPASGAMSARVSRESLPGCGPPVCRLCPAVPYSPISRPISAHFAAFHSPQAAYSSAKPAPKTSSMRSVSQCAKTASSP